uniref:NADH dehydrogenase subunit 5 n=1 Tax=Virpazaria ripkeni TaxID=2939667 RepID=UPI002028B155|nr:NADH dehydrogenase subunit 5 [Virpazaria ripkeni]UPV69722.1 NADH dehydrogenase subunit 5 [Virpazaria ripkeni]UPV69735.1 NADH dehydrogenase subunit 5 [Virpazaria ripkeni]
MNRLPLLLLFTTLVSVFLSFFMFKFQSKTYLLEVQLMNNNMSNLTMLMIFDKISLSFSMMVMLISSCVFMFSCSYMKLDPYKFRFSLILLMFVLSMNILIFSGSLFLLLLGWDGLGISSFMLIIYYQNKTSLSGGYLTLLTNRVGDVLIILSIPILLFNGSFNIFPIDMSYQNLLLVLSFAALTKSAQYPFSAWLPAAMAAPTPVSALVHSSTLVTAGVYLIIRLSYNLSCMNPFSNALLFCGAITSLLGGISATYENDIKKIIAFSTLSQLGLMMFCLGMNMPNLALLHLYTHATFKALLFLSAGLILMLTFGNQDMRNLGTILMHSPMILTFFNISSLCLMGAPFVSAFYSKHVIYEMMFMGNLNLFSVLIMMVSMTLTGIYSIRTIKILSWSNINNNTTSSFMSLNFYWPLITLFLLSITSGKWFSLLNISWMHHCFIPMFFQTLMNMMILLGLLIALLMKSPKKSFPFASMFFLWSSSNKMNMYMTPLLKYSNTLDYGWFEPYTLLKLNMLKFSLFMNKSFNLPNHILLHLTRGLYMTVFMMILCLYF